MAGHPKSILKGLQELKSLGYPLWGMASDLIADTMAKRGFFALRGPGAGEIIKILSSFIFTNAIFTKIKEIKPNGSIIIEYEDLGKVEKYFIANKTYFDKLLLNPKVPEQAKRFIEKIL